MSAAAITVAPPRRRTLPQLALAIEREHALAMQAGRGMVEHAIRCGEALLEAQQQVPWGEWETWLAEHFPKSRDTAFNYMRVAQHREHITGAESVVTALRMLKSIGVETEDRRGRPESETKRLALELQAQGLGPTAIAEQLGISVRAAAGLLRTPEQRAAWDAGHRRRRRAASDRKSVEQRALGALEDAAERLAALASMTANEQLRAAVAEAATRVADTSRWLEEELAKEHP